MQKLILKFLLNKVKNNKITKFILYENIKN